MRHSLLALSLITFLGCSAQDSDPPDDDECTDVFFADSDGDGFGDPGTTATDCAVPTGFVSNADDCDDTDGAVHPNGSEVCDGVDNDCDALIDTADPSIDLTTQRAYYRDADGDGFGDAGDSTISCDRPVGYVVDDTDCDDTETAVNPGATEVCDNLDNDCDSLFDDSDDSLDASTAGVFYVDEDNDNFGAGPEVIMCNPSFGFAAQAGDCDDDDNTSHPGGVELCDGADNDCDSGIDGTPASPNQCGGFTGSYAGSYSHSAVEKLGATIINQMHCTGGSSSLVFDLNADPPLQGTVSCTYSGGLVAFDNNQTGEIAATVDLDGNVSGRLTHHYESQLTKFFNFEGTIAGGTLEIIDTGSMFPHPMSAIAWEVDYSILGN